jgi:hypothetical protein
MDEITTEYITINNDTIYDITEKLNMKNNPKSKSKSKSKSKRKHLDSDNFIMPEIKNYNSFKPNNYKVQELKDICKYHKLKTSGTKEFLNNTIYTFLKHSYNAIIIQKVWKKYCIKKIIYLHGPASINRNLCVNETEFFTMEPLTTISESQFFSFKDIDNMIYGFDIMSLYQLIKTDGIKATNPYNRNPITINIRKELKKLILYSKITGNELNIEIEEPKEKTGNIMQQYIMKIKSLFQEIDRLGNYTNVDWLLNLCRGNIIRFMRELYDIWHYRAHLTQTIKNEICPPNGNPFLRINIFNLAQLEMPELYQNLIKVLEPLIKNGINHESRCLGTNYILCALTIVNHDAAEALPWLYYSVSQY